MEDSKRTDWIPLACLALALLTVGIVYFNVGGGPLERLKVIVGYVILILLFFMGLMVIIGMARGTIDLSLLLAEAGGGASMSRFQLLIFTIVVAFSLFLMTVSTLKFPEIPNQVLTLLGISATTYAVSKGIQASSPDLSKGKKPDEDGAAKPPDGKPGGGGQGPGGNQGPGGGQGTGDAPQE
jgi:hypothetical protein